MAEKSIRDSISDAMLRVFYPDTYRERMGLPPAEEQPNPYNIPPLTGAMYPPEKTEYDEFYGGRNRR